MAASTPTLASNPGTLARIGLAGVSVVALIAFALYAAVLASRVDELEVGDPVPVTVPGGAAVSGPFGAGVVAPDFELQTVDGQTVRLSDFAGRPVWINVWASWCAPCRAEMPDIEQVYRELPGATPGGAPDATGKGPVLLLVSLGEDPADVRRYLRVHPLPAPHPGRPGLLLHPRLPHHRAPHPLLHRRRGEAAGDRHRGPQAERDAFPAGQRISAAAASERAPSASAVRDAGGEARPGGGWAPRPGPDPETSPAVSRK